MKLVAYCEECGHRHMIDADPSRPDRQMTDWYTKHMRHSGVGIISPHENPRMNRRLFQIGLRKIMEFFRWRAGKPFRWLAEELRAWGQAVPMTQAKLFAMLSNANVKLVYAATTAFTITLASLATSTTLVAGRNGSAVSNRTNLYLDYGITGQVTTGTTPTVSTFIETWMIAANSDGGGTPVWPDSLTNADAAFTTTSRNQLYTYGTPMNSSVVTATSNIKYPFKWISLAGMFGGACPTDFEPFVVHSTAANLNATGGNHFLNYCPVYASVI